MLEKTPDHVYKLNMIRHEFPSSKVIHLIRHPDPTVNSYCKAAKLWGGDVDHTKSYQKWFSSVIETFFQVKKHNDLVIYYEDILLNTSETIEQLNRYLGTNINEQVFIKTFSSHSESIVSKNETWKRNNFSNSLDHSKAEVQSSGQLEKALDFLAHIVKLSKK